VIRQRIAATVARRAPQVMVKVTAGRIGAIAAHFFAICKNGQLRIEDDRGGARGQEASARPGRPMARQRIADPGGRTGAKPSTSCAADAARTGRAAPGAGAAAREFAKSDEGSLLRWCSHEHQPTHRST
jgi:hypothetical protein